MGSKICLWWVCNSCVCILTYLGAWIGHNRFGTMPTTPGCGYFTQNDAANNVWVNDEECGATTSRASLCEAISGPGNIINNNIY